MKRYLLILLLAASMFSHSIYADEAISKAYLSAGIAEANERKPDIERSLARIRLELNAIRNKASRSESRTGFLGEGESLTFQFKSKEERKAYDDERVIQLRSLTKELHKEWQPPTIPAFSMRPGMVGVVEAPAFRYPRAAGSSAWAVYSNQIRSANEQQSISPATIQVVAVTSKGFRGEIETYGEVEPSESIFFMGFPANQVFKGSRITLIEPVAIEPPNEHSNGSLVVRALTLQELDDATKYVKDNLKPSKSPYIREWTDASGQFKVTAELISSNEKEVLLKKQDDKLLTLPLSKLSLADRRWLKDN